MTEAGMPQQRLLNLRDYISQQYGIHYPPGRLTELAQKLTAASGRMGFSDPDLCTGQILAGRLDEHQHRHLIDALTVGETYFFREIELFNAVVKMIIPGIAAQGSRRLRIWCAGCATGEEPYSLAMLLRESLPAQEQWQVSILATDINSSFLAKAREGNYTSWSFRNTPEPYRTRYFREVGTNRWELAETIRRMVTFQQLNLARDQYPSLATGTQELDLILCRNVLMYFSPETIRATAQKFAHCLNDRGWLAVSQTECGDYFTTPFDTVQSDDAFLYRKKDPLSPPAASPPVWSPTNGQPKTARFAAAPLPATPVAPLLAEQQRRVTPPPPAAVPADQYHSAKSLADQGRLTEACAVCREWLAHDSLNCRGHYLHAVILQELGRCDEAGAALRKVLYLEPDSVMAWYSLGLIARKQANQREALRAFDTVGRLLTAYEDDALLPEAEGLSAGRLREFLATMGNR